MKGSLHLYQDTTTGSVQMYVSKDQLDKEFIYQSFSINGPVAYCSLTRACTGNTCIQDQKSF
jgi:hypothetical protein